MVLGIEGVNNERGSAARFAIGSSSSSEAGSDKIEIF